MAADTSFVAEASKSVGVRKGAFRSAFALVLSVLFISGFRKIKEELKDVATH